MGESEGRTQALPYLKISLGSATAKALREKAVETASYLMPSPLNRPSEGPAA